MLTELQGLLSKARSRLPFPPKKRKLKIDRPPLDLAAIRSFLEVATSLPQGGALQSKAHIAGATRLVQALGLPSHHDSQKNWDTLKILNYLLSHVDISAPILDAGSGSRSAILGWLYEVGYRNLFACDRAPVKRKFYTCRNIPFTEQDLTSLSYPDEQFAAVTSISVIEHGVDLGKFFAETARILKPGGWLLVSTDYWPETVNCAGIFPYGEGNGEMKIFNRQEIEKLLRLAKKHGLELADTVDLAATEKSVRWEKVDRDYTFLFLPFCKRASQEA